MLRRVAEALWPDLGELPEWEQLGLMADLAGTVIAAPIAVLGIAWLLAETDLEVMRQRAPIFALMFFLSIGLSYLSYFQVEGEQAGRYSYTSSDLMGIVTFSAVFVFGPTAVWIRLAARLTFYLVDLSRAPTRALRWNAIRNMLTSVGLGTLGPLSALWVFAALGGQLPLEAGARSLGLALVGVVVDFVVAGGGLWLLVAVMIALVRRQAVNELPGIEGRLWRFLLVAQIPAFFGILAAMVFTETGLLLYLYLLVGVFLVSLLARRLSQAAVLNQQRARQLGQLEQLERAILEQPADEVELPALLATDVPRMFDYTRAEIRLFDGQDLLLHPPDYSPLDEQIWAWLRQHPEPTLIRSGEPVPWSGEKVNYYLRLVPILSAENQTVIGGIALSLKDRQLASWIDASLPTLQVLAEQIAAALQRAEDYVQRLAYQRVQQELEFARQIQVSFLPERLPVLEDWELAARLVPARQTSGDFYDVIQLPERRLGLVMADVADKGVGAALFMALSRTLIRTYAMTFPQQPAQTLAAANSRILQDTSNDMFVTVFYGILDLQTGHLTYANGGHNPPFLVENGDAKALGNTGMPLGILADAAWGTETVTLPVGAMLTLYTDGVPEAHNTQRMLFGEERFLKVLEAQATETAGAALSAILAAVRQFVDDAPQFDDQALLLLKRK